MGLDEGDTAALKNSARRRRRNPDRTRQAILEASGAILSKHGPEGLSVAQVAKLAGVNRGTAYQHFQTREQLSQATTAWVSENLCKAVFGEVADADVSFGRVDPLNVAQRLAEFAMDNPELGRVWLFDILSSNRPSADPFWKQYKTRFEEYARSEYAQPGIDCEVHSVLMLIGAFLWPVWARAHARTAKDRREMAKRYSNEIVRLSMHGSMRPDKYPDIDAKLDEDQGRRKRQK
jgi:AcrR family transcriptional regulator